MSNRQALIAKIDQIAKRCTDFTQGLRCAQTDVSDITDKLPCTAQTAYEDGLITGLILSTITTIDDLAGELNLVARDWEQKLTEQKSTTLQSFVAAHLAKSDEWSTPLVDIQTAAGKAVGSPTKMAQAKVAKELRATGFSCKFQRNSKGNIIARWNCKLV